LRIPTAYILSPFFVRQLCRGRHRCCRFTFRALLITRHSFARTVFNACISTSLLCCDQFRNTCYNCSMSAAGLYTWSTCGCACSCSCGSSSLSSLSSSPLCSPSCNAALSAHARQNLQCCACQTGATCLNMQKQQSSFE